MTRPFRFAALAGLFAAATFATASTPVSADTNWAKVNNFNGHVIANSYLGQPDLGLTLAMVEAGGGPKDFQAATLVKALTGPLFDKEVASLNARFGQEDVAKSLATLTLAVNSALAYVEQNHVPLPAKPAVNPKDGKALATALYQAGTTPFGRFDVGYMLEHLLSHPLHLRVMHDIDGTPGYGPVVDKNFHVVLTAMMNDLKTAYDL